MLRENLAHSWDNSEYCMLADRAAQYTEFSSHQKDYN